MEKVLVIAGPGSSPVTQITESQIENARDKGLVVHVLRPGAEGPWPLKVVAETYAEVQPAEVWVFGEANSKNFQDTVGLLSSKYSVTFVDFTEFNSSARVLMSNHHTVEKTGLLTASGQKPNRPKPTNHEDLS